MFTARRTTEGVLTLRGRAAFVAKFLTPAESPRPHARSEQRAEGVGGKTGVSLNNLRFKKESDGLVWLGLLAKEPFKHLHLNKGRQTKLSVRQSSVTIRR